MSLFALSGCGDDPFAVQWFAAPETALIYSLARPELNLPSAFSFNPRGPLQVETPGASGNWDIVLDTQESALVLLTPRALGIDSRARIAPLEGLDFDDVREAPSDSSAYVLDAPVMLKTGTIYVVQTRQVTAQFGQICVFYAKLEAITVDVEEGLLEFVYDTNPFCNDRRLDPPDS